MSAGFNREEDDNDDIAAQVGAGSGAAVDSELDTLKEMAEAQLNAVDSMLGAFGGFVAAFCHHRSTQFPFSWLCLVLVM